MKKLGFGLMRLPLYDEDTKKVNVEEMEKLVDYFMSKGYNYYDTAFPYLNGNSERSVKEVLSKRYPRDSFIIASKLPIFDLEKEEDMEKIFDEQLERCGVEYFDYYMLHNVSSKHVDKFTRIDSFSFIKEKKSEGKIKHIGISCHDSPEFLENILIEHPEIEFVQLQINYLDWHDDVIDSKGVYEVACKYGKPVIIMEGLKGGALADLPEDAVNLLERYDKGKSPVSWAFRFNLSLENVMVILSGINRMEDMVENIDIFECFIPLNKNDYGILEEVAGIINKNVQIKCTDCGYCLPKCPKSINIAYFFKLYNSQKLLNQTHSIGMYYRNFSAENVRASDCVECGNCVAACPQKIDIPNKLRDVVDLFE